MPFIVASRKLSPAGLARRFGEVQPVDVTSRGVQPWVRFSPFYPHGGIPVPLSPGHIGASVEGIWQGLKVFAGVGIDLNTIANATAKGLKRTERANGPVQGHQAGIDGDHLLTYAEARCLIYLPAYRWVLEHCLKEELSALAALGEDRTVALLDYETNEDILDLTRPLSHASLVKRWLEGA